MKSAAPTTNQLACKHLRLDYSETGSPVTPQRLFDAECALPFQPGGGGLYSQVSVVHPTDLRK